MLSTEPLPIIEYNRIIILSLVFISIFIIFIFDRVDTILFKYVKNSKI